MTKKKLWIPLTDSKNNYMNLYDLSMIHTDSQQHDNLNKRMRFYSLFQMVNFSLSRGQDFHFAECGCFKGQSTWGISSLLKQKNFKNNFFIFDSFEGGLSKFHDNDLTNLNFDMSANAIEEKRKRFSSNELQVTESLREFDFVKIFSGWIPKKFIEVETFKFQFVHIDVDLYEPTLNSLEFFFPRLVPGGVIVCDDYNFADFPGAKAAWDEYFSNKQCFMQYEVPNGSKWLVK